MRAALAALALGAASLAGGCSAAPAETASGKGAWLPDLPRSRIVLMSSLPLVHGETADMTALIAGEGQPHPLYLELNAAHDLTVADAIDARALAGADLVILIQPRALPPVALVALDDYVRGGGRLLLFADPSLEWPSRFGLGDPRGPLRSSLISPLLAHWGLELLDPGGGSVRLPQSGMVMEHPGQFTVRPGKIGDVTCRLADGDHVAHCRIGKGRAVFVADADLLYPHRSDNTGNHEDAARHFVAELFSAILRRPDEAS